VEASEAALETSTAELGTVVGEQSVVDLPLNGRNFTQLLMLTPGASRIMTAQNSGGGASTAISTSSVPVFIPGMHGQSNRSNFFMLDGINDNEDVFASFAYVPVVDDIQEFKVQSHNDQAQYGGVTGGIVNVVTRSGTGQLHGGVWEFNRNQAFSAANPFTHLTIPLNWNQYGFNFGGPYCGSTR
jgi:outer membrane receptor protein involved in Fe transport